MVPDHDEGQYVLTSFPGSRLLPSGVEWFRSWVSQFRRLDDRCLALLRIGLACVLLWDIHRGWLLADDWLAMQGYDQWPLPVGRSDAAGSLRWSLGLLALATMALGVGWRTRWIQFIVWFGACGYQYASRYTIDYHDAIVCQLLLWSLVLPLGRVWSIDAWQRRNDRPWPAWLTAVAATGLLVTIGWIYLTTLLAKDGPAWWSQGYAVRLAVADRAVITPMGVWCLEHLPDAWFRLMTWGTLLAEALIPVFLLSARRRLRNLAAMLMVGLHGAMWMLMDLGAFPLLMISAAAALYLPPAAQAGSGTRVGTQTIPDGGGRGSVWLPRMVGLLLAANVALAADDERQLRWPVEPDTDIARWLRRGHTFLAAEPVWAMYAPEPLRFTGWWVAVGQTTQGAFVDLLTGQIPSITPPTRVDSPLHWAYLGNPPSEPVAQQGTTQQAYLQFLMRRELEQRGNDPLTWLGLIYMHETLVGPNTGRIVGLFTGAWPVNLPVRDVAEALDIPLFRVEPSRLGDSDWEPQPLLAPDDASAL